VRFFRGVKHPPPHISISTFGVYSNWVVLGLGLYAPISDTQHIHLSSFRVMIYSTTPNINAIMGVCFGGELCITLMSNYLWDAKTFKTLTFQTKKRKPLTLEKCDSCNLNMFSINGFSSSTFVPTQLEFSEKSWNYQISRWMIWPGMEWLFWSWDHVVGESANEVRSQQFKANFYRTVRNYPWSPEISFDFFPIGAVMLWLTSKRFQLAQLCWDRLQMPPKLQISSHLL